MSINSVNTNVGAMVALQSLNRTNEELTATQKRISTGLRVSDARDDGAAFAVAERIRGDLASTASANQQLGGVKGLLDTTRTGLDNVSKALQDVKATVVKLSDSNITASQRQQYIAALKEQFSQIKNFISDTTYNGQSMLNTKAAAAATAGDLGQVSTVRNGEGATYAFGKVNTYGINRATAFAALTGLGMTAGGGVTSSSTALNAAIGSFAAALTKTGAVNKAIGSTLTALNNLGSYSRYVDSQINFNKAKMDSQEAGMGALIDADLAKESARLQSLQIRQQLGTQALSIANQAPQALLSLFR